MGRSTLTAEVVVLGAGALGCVVAHDLALAGRSVIALDRWEPGHAFGSSHGDTRVIRRAYFEDPAYVPLLQRSYQRWADLEEGARQTLYHPAGVLQIGPEDGVVVPGVLESAAQHELSVERVGPEALRRRFPGFELPPGCVGVFEPEAGYLWVEQGVRAWAARARCAGAEIRAGQTVLDWSSSGRGFEVLTEQHRLRCKTLILTPGAWAPQLLPEPLASALEVRRKTLHWYPGGELLSPSSPCWLYEQPEGYFYGFPSLQGQLKAAEHSGGEPVEDPLALDRSLRSSDRQPLERFLQRCLPTVDTRAPSRHAVCMYTMTPDEHFLLGSWPDEPGLWIGAGLSGHGFKLVPALGEALVQAVLGLASPPELLQPSRLLR